MGEQPPSADVLAKHSFVVGAPISVHLGGRCGYFSAIGAVLIPMSFNNCDAFDERGMAQVTVDDKSIGGRKSGYIGVDGKPIIPIVYSEIGGFNGGELAPFKQNGMWGYLNRNGKVVVKPKFENAYGFNFGFAAVKVNGKWGFINPDGKLEIPAVFDSDTYGGFGGFSDCGIATIPWLGKYRYIDKSGKFISDKATDNPWNGFSYGSCIALVESGDKVAYMKSNGDYLIEPTEKFKFSRPFINGLASVTYADGSTTYLNVEGKEAFPSKFLVGYGFGPDGTAVVAIGTKKWTHIDKNGNPLYPAVYEAAQGFEGGVAMVKKDGLWGLINAKGEFIAKPEYAIIGRFDSYHRAPAKKGDVWGLLDLQGTFTAYPRLASINSDHAWDAIPVVMKDGQEGVLIGERATLVYEDTLTCNDKISVPIVRNAVDSIIWPKDTESECQKAIKLNIEYKQLMKEMFGDDVPERLRRYIK